MTNHSCELFPKIVKWFKLYHDTIGWSRGAFFLGLRVVKSLSNLWKGGGYGEVGLRDLWLRIWSSCWWWWGGYSRRNFFWRSARWLDLPNMWRGQRWLWAGLRTIPDRSWHSQLWSGDIIIRCHRFFIRGYRWVMPTLFSHPWLFEVLEEYKFQITNHKYQTNNNDQNSKFQTCFLFWSLNIGIWDLFVIWCLEFGIS